MSEPKTKPRKVVLELPSDIVDAIEKYLAWDDKRDPSKIGALNLVAHIGERIAGVYVEQIARKT